MDHNEKVCSEIEDALQARVNQNIVGRLAAAFSYSKMSDIYVVPLSDGMSAMYFKFIMIPAWQLFRRLIRIASAAGGRAKLRPRYLHLS